MKSILIRGAGCGIGRATALLCGVPILVLVGAGLTACSRSQAEPPATAQCRATVAVAGTEKSCPVGGLRFHVAVAGCRRSSGTFSYHYLLVDEGHKENVTRAGEWRSAEPQWEQTEHVPLACDQEIDDVEDAHATSCSCAGG